MTHLYQVTVENEVYTVKADRVFFDRGEVKFFTKDDLVAYFPSVISVLRIKPPETEEPVAPSDDNEDFTLTTV